jgi:hypothetical protein
MKVMWIVCNESLSNDVREILDSDPSIKGYTVWEGLHSVNKIDNRSRWGDSIWPGSNWAFWIIAEVGCLERVAERVRKFKNTDMAKLAGIKIWMQDIEPVL